MSSKKSYGAAWLCLFTGYQILTFILLYGFWNVYGEYLANFWFGHVLTSLVIAACGWIVYDTFFRMIRVQKADIRRCIPVLITAAGSCIAMIVLRIVTILTPFWITLFLFCTALIVECFFLVLARAGMNRKDSGNCFFIEKGGEFFDEV